MGNFSSKEGWDRHSYSILGTFSRGAPVPMKMQSAGVFTAKVPVTDFKIVVDEDPAVAIYPVVTTSSSGEYMIEGPSADFGDTYFAIYNVVDEDPEYEVTLDLTTLDRRKVVTWQKAA